MWCTSAHLLLRAMRAAQARGTWEQPTWAIQLPTPIDICFKSGNANDAAALEQCFAADAVVHDEVMA